VEKLDELAVQFFMAAQEARGKIYEEAAAVADGVGSHAQHYLKVMQKVVNGSEEYFEKEGNR
jgi:protein disulfide-isomerase A6